MKIAIISDIHSNLSALESILLDIDNNSCDECICLGDIVGYGPDPLECINLIKQRNIKCLMGNHDAAVCNLISLDYFNSYAKKSIEWTINKLTPIELDYLKTFIDQIKIKNILFIHGALGDKFDYIINIKKLEENIKILTEKYKNINICIFGHTHIPFISRNNSFEIITSDSKLIIKNFEKDIVFINPGSVGQPRCGQNNNANYCLLNTTTGEVHFRFISYDVKKTYNKIIKIGLPKFLADRLISGY